MAEDKLYTLLQQRLGVSGTVISRQFDTAGFSLEEREKLAEQLQSVADKNALMLQAVQSIQAKKEQQNQASTADEPNAKLDNLFIQTMQPIIGRAMAQEAYAYLVEDNHYPELKNPQCQQKYADYLAQIDGDQKAGKSSEYEKFAIFQATIKIARIKETEKTSAGDPDFCDFDKYRNFETLVSRTLPAIHTFGRKARNILLDNSVSTEQKERIARGYDIANPLAFARTLLYNDYQQKEETNHAQAREFIKGITWSIGDKGLQCLQSFVDQARRASIIGSHNIANTPNYRRLTPEERQEIIRNAQLGIETPRNTWSQTLANARTGVQND